MLFPFVWVYEVRLYCLYNVTSFCVLLCVCVVQMGSTHHFPTHLPHEIHVQSVFLFLTSCVFFYTVLNSVNNHDQSSKCSSAVLIFQSKPVKEKKKKLHIKTQCDLALEWNDQKYGTNKNLFRDVAEKWLCRNMKSFWICMENFIW